MQKSAGADSTATGKSRTSVPGTVAKGDTLGGKALADSAAVDTLANPDDLQNTVEYTAQDSTIMDAVLKQVHLYGNAEVNYGTINLKANYIRLNWVTNEVYAVAPTTPRPKKWPVNRSFRTGR